MEMGQTHEHHLGLGQQNHELGLGHPNDHDLALGQNQDQQEKDGQDYGNENELAMDETDHGDHELALESQDLDENLELAVDRHHEMAIELSAI
ncbi:hypothetical protein Patl1_23231 [Pistacia atlantica]|uniref:Uncharacterized protein n=1 Tax=Pistacia atlantica TaxID=434234 RepID=A0ACC0ZYT4_9ROSI|nr:hypothetical protein Patl1_23231 [Pistacia atlantica]